MITMEQAKRYGNIHTEIMIDNGLIHDKEIREPLFDYLEETYGKIRIIEEKMMGAEHVFCEAVPTYDFYYDTTVDEASWQRLKTALQERGGKHLQLLQEMSEWVGNGFEDHKSFTMMAN